MEGGSDSPQSSAGEERFGRMTPSSQDGSGSGELRLTVESFEIDKSAVKTAKGGFGASELLERVPEARRIRVEFSGVQAWVPLLEVNGGTVAKVKKSLSRHMSLVKGKELPPTKKQILYGMTGSADPGEVLAMMGPSGSGKTSLLSILGDRAPKNVDMQGTIRFNGLPLTKAIKRRIGYVTQDDMMYPTLTVYETLYFAALLRLPKTMTREEKIERAEAVIAALGLEKCRNTIIGGPLRRGVSGGERKRVAVGHELLIDPAVIMLDEPTSGLDATAAMHLIKILRQLAEGGRSVITTIHQPSSRLYLQLDSLMLLSEGETMYYGNAQLVINWLKNCGHPVPLGVNVADFMLDLANGDFMHDQRNGEKYRKDLIYSFAQVAKKTVKGVRREEDCKLKDDPDDKPLDSLQGIKTPGIATEAVTSIPHKDSSDKWGAGFWEQLKVLSVRTFRIRRFDTYSSQNLILFMGVALIVGLLWWQTGGENSLLVANDTAGLLFFVLLFHQFTAMFNSLFVFPSEFKMMVKERSSGMYRLSAFYFARTLSELPLDCTIPSLLIIIMYWMTGLRPTAGAFISHWLAILLTRFIGQSIGLIIGAMILNFKSASTVSSLTMLFMMLAGGFYIRKLPGWLDWINYASLIYYGYNVVLKIEFSGRQFVDCGGLGARKEEQAECVDVESLKEGLNLGVDTDESVIVDVAVLIGILVLLRLALYQVLKIKTST